MNHSKIIFFFVFLLNILFLSFFTRYSNAVYFADDTVILFKNNNPISSSDYLWAADYGYGDYCNQGTCKIGQQFYPVTIYRLRHNNIIPFNKYTETGNEKQGIEYHWYLLSNSFSTVEFNPKPSYGGEGCGSQNCIGGRLGSYRNITFDVENKTIKYIDEDESPLIYLQQNGFKSFILLMTSRTSVQLILVISLTIISIFLFLYFKKNKSGKK